MSTINVKIDTEKEARKTDVKSLVNIAAAIEISNQAEFEASNIVLVDVKKRIKELDEQRKAITKPLDDAKKEVMNLFRDPIDLLERAEKYIKGLMLKYTDKMEREAREEQARLQKLADQEAEKEKKKIEAKIERAVASGKENKVEDLTAQLETIVPITAPVIAPAIEKISGVVMKSTWIAEVVNIDEVPREYMEVNLKALNKIAQATKGSIKIAGVKFSETKSIASRG